MVLPEVTTLAEARDAIRDLAEEIEKLSNELAWFKRQMFGSKTEHYIPEDNTPSLFPEEESPEPSVERANRRRRAVLAGKSAQERWEEEFSHFTRRERESIYLEIKRLAEWILETFPRKKRLRKDAGAHAWRIAIQRYLESKEYIRLFRDGSELH